MNVSFRYPRARKVGFLFLLAFSGCCSHPAAIVALDRGISATQGDMDDDQLPVQAREIATGCHDVFCQVKFNLDGTPVPDDVQKRKAARDAEAAKDKKPAEGEGQ